MSIHKRMNRNGTATYSVRFREGESNRRASFASKREAELFDASVRLKAQRGELHSLDAGRITLGEFAETWWEQYIKPRRAKSTVHGYAIAWNLHVLPYLCDMQLREITPRVIEEWRFKLEDKGVGGPTIRKSMSVLQSCLQRAVIYGELRSNPCREIRKPSGKRVKMIRPLTPFEVEGMRQHLLGEGKHRDAALVSVLAYAGLRPGEALGLSWEHVRKNTILVEQSASFGEIKETKTGTVRSVQLFDALRNDLKDWRARSGQPSALVFPGITPEVPWSREAQKSWGRKAFARAAVTAGRDDATPYHLRHSFASLLIHEGRSVVEVAAQMGHAPTMTLGTYAHVFADLGDDKRPARELIDDARARVAWEHSKNPNRVCSQMFPQEATVRRLAV